MRARAPDGVSDESRASGWIRQGTQNRLAGRAKVALIHGSHISVPATAIVLGQERGMGMGTRR